jgi:hypothetical protein
MRGSTNTSLIMSKNNVEKLLFAGGADQSIRLKYNQIETKEKFVAAAGADGCEFSLAELDEVLNDEDMSFESEAIPDAAQSGSDETLHSLHRTLLFLGSRAAFIGGGNHRVRRSQPDQRADRDRRGA